MSRRLALILIGSTGLLPACRHNSPSAQPGALPAPAEGYVSAADGAQLYYRIAGSGPDTVIILHGGPGFSMEYFAADLEPLARQHTLLFYDQRGAGRSTLVSDSSRLTGSVFAADLEAIRAHFGIDKIVLLGHSWGGALAALYAMEYPTRVRRMLIVDGMPLRRELLLTAWENMARARDSAEFAALDHWMQARRANPGDPEPCHEYYVRWFRPFFADPAALSRSKGDFCAGTADSRRNKLESIDRYTVASLGNWDWRDRLRTFGAPTLVLHGETDPLPLAGAREWAATLPNARLLVLPHAGHFPYLETPDAFYSAVNSFLRGGWPAGSEVIVRTQ